jgi:hypothetical protein
MRPRNLFFAGALAGAVAFALASSLLQPAPVAPVQDSERANLAGPQAAHPLFAADRQTPEHKEARHEDRIESEPNGPDAFERGADAEWNLLVGGMLEWEAERRTGQKLAAAQRERLLAELAQLRDASLALQEAPSEPDDPAELRERLTRTLALAQADETFRRELGIGVAAFIQGLNPHAVEDVSSALGQQ